jgi:hypothetical protein
LQPASRLLTLFELLASWPAAPIPTRRAASLSWSGGVPRSTPDRPGDNSRPIDGLNDQISSIRRSAAHFHERGGSGEQRRLGMKGHKASGSFGWRKWRTGQDETANTYVIAITV